MTGLSLAKTELPPSWIGASVGEPILVRENLFAHFDIPSLTPIFEPRHFEYTPPAGFPPLVRFLEDKFQARCIVHNGAKQAIGSLFYALNKVGRNSIYLREPYWSLFPPLMEMHGCYRSGGQLGPSTAQLLVSPGNPDNYNYSDDEWEKNAGLCRGFGIPVICDAAYYNHIYLPPETELKPRGDVQVFTASKLLGLSQLRIGFSVFHDTKLYDDVIHYQEAMTVGVSVLSQMFALNILEEMAANHKTTITFEKKCREDFQKNRETANLISSSILDIDPAQKTGMFLWAKCHDLKAFEESKIVVAEGTGFGMKGHIRMNLGLKNEDVKEIVERLNDWGH